MIDRDQNTAESYLISAGVIVVSTCYAATALGSILHPVVAALLALPLAAIAIEIPFFVSALLAALLRIRDAKPINGALSAAVLFGISAWMTFSATWVRFIAWGVFVVVAMNAIAAVFVWPLRKRIDELERSYREASP